MKQKINLGKKWCWSFPCFLLWSKRETWVFYPCQFIRLWVKIQVKKENTLEIIDGIILFSNISEIFYRQLFINHFHLLSDWMEGTGFSVELRMPSWIRPKHWGCTVNSELQIILIPSVNKLLLSNSTDWRGCVWSNLGLYLATLSLDSISDTVIQQDSPITDNSFLFLMPILMSLYIVFQVGFLHLSRICLKAFSKCLDS